MLSIEEYIQQPIEIKQELGILFKRRSPKVIMDIGSCTGEDAIKYSNLFPGATVYAFEPLANNVAIMRQHFQQYRKSNIQIENIALSNENGFATFYVSGGNPFEDVKEGEYTTLIPKEWNKSSSLLPPGNDSEKYLPWLKFEQQQQVTTQRLDMYLKEKQIYEVDFIHLDVQGAELKVLEGMGKSISRLKVLWVEVENVELYAGQALKTDIIDFLRTHDFVLLKDTSIGQIAGDCLFVNRSYLSFDIRVAFFARKMKSYANRLLQRTKLLL